MENSWRTIAIGGRDISVFEPERPAQPSFGILHLQGDRSEAIACDSGLSETFGRMSLACFSIDGRGSWWGDRVCTAFDTLITPEQFLLATLLPAIRDNWHLAPPALGLFGFGIGGQAALRLGFKRPELFPAVAAVAPAIEYHRLYSHGTSLDEIYSSPEQCRQDTVPMHVHPSRFPEFISFCADPDEEHWFPGCDRLHEKLNALGVTHTADLTTRAAGAPQAYVAQKSAAAIDFLYNGLKQLSRRLL